RSPCSTLFPYTTLFRSIVACPCTCGHKRECGVDRRVKLGLGTYAAGHQTPGVDGDDNGLIALDLILAGGQLRTAGGGGPGDVPEDRKSTRLNSSHVKIS